MEATEALKAIIESGLLGALLVVALLTVAFMYRENKALQEKRIDDLRTARDAIAEPLGAVKRTVELILDAVQDNGRRR